ncbi:MAG: hypothetical protein K0Q73_9220 [Paenibacillus sp.]|nr:hypothetical protein [Paenibacillus sp.]
MTFHSFIFIAKGEAGNPFLGGTDPYFQGTIDWDHIDTENQFAEGMRRIKEGLVKEPLLWMKWMTIGKLLVFFKTMWVGPSIFNGGISLVLRRPYGLYSGGSLCVRYASISDAGQCLFDYTSHLLTSYRLDYLSPAAEGDLNSSCFAQYSMISLLRTIPMNLSESSTIGTKFCTLDKSIRSTISA